MCTRPYFIEPGDKASVYSVYAPGRHWLAHLSPSNLPDHSGRGDQTFTYYRAGYVQKPVGLFICHEW